MDIDKTLLILKKNHSRVNRKNESDKELPISLRLQIRSLTKKDIINRINMLVCRARSPDIVIAHKMIIKSSKIFIVSKKDIKIRG